MITDYGIRAKVLLKCCLARKFFSVYGFPLFDKAKTDFYEMYA